MIYLGEKTAAQTDIPALNSFVFLGGLAILLPFFIHQQWLTGPMVNAILILTLFLVGLRGALLLCLIPSIVALSSGLLPAILAPVVPFIMLSNVVFVLSLDYIYNKIVDTDKGFWLGIAVGAFLKFIFLFFSANLAVKLLAKQDLAAKVFQMMSWSQLVTALIGGMIAGSLLKWLKRI